MAAIEQIRRVVTQYESSGAEKAAADFNAVAAAETNAARAGEQVATVTDLVSKRQISAAAAYDRLRRTIDEDYRAQQQLAKGQATLDRALQQGVLSAEEYTRALAMLEARTLGVSKTATVPMTGIASTSKLASHEVTNLTAQLQDIGVSLAGGMSPFTVMMQQGSQISAMMGDRGLKTIISGVGTALLSLINPTTAVLAGFTALYVGGTYAYEALIGSSKSLDDQLKTQDALVKKVKNSYDEATGTFTKWVNASRAATIVDITKTLSDLRKELKGASQDFLVGGLFGGGVGTSTRGGFRVADQFKEFSAVIGDFRRSAQGADDILKLFDSIGKVGAANPALTETASKLLDLLRPAAEAAGKSRELDAALKALQGTVDATDFRNLGFDQLAKNAESAAKTIERLKSDISLIGNDRGRAIRDAVSGLAPGATFEQTAQVALLAGEKYDREKAAQEAEKSAREAQSEAKRASDDLAREGKRVWEDTRTAAEEYAAEIDKLNNLLAKGAINQETYARATAKAAEEMEKARTEEYRKSLEKSNNPADGVTLAALDYQKQAGSMAKQTADVTTNMFSSMEDALVNFVKTGKLNFTDLVNSMIADLARFAIRQAAMGFMKMLGGVGGSSAPISTSSGMTTGIYHAGGVVGEAPPSTRTVDSSVFIGAPRFHSGFAPDEFPAVLQRGEAVFTAGQMRALGAQINAGRQGGQQQGGNVFFDVKNYGQERAQMKETKVGNDRYIEMVVGKAVNKNIARGGTDGSNRARYGLTPAANKRG